MKMKAYFLFVLIVFFSGCQKAKQEDTKIISPKGKWSILSITNKAGVTPPNMSDMIGGVAVFTDLDYTLKNKMNEDVEKGLWSNQTSNVFSIKPQTNTVFSNSSSSYKFSITELTGSTIQLKISLNKANEPENNLFIQLTR
ncbi:hypothetical protein AD998_08615 [bacterium 336/3]|nr:hypothetical protein AD998_08615 [bacterium 336/3]